MTYRPVSVIFSMNGLFKYIRFYHTVIASVCQIRLLRKYAATVRYHMARGSGHII